MDFGQQRMQQQDAARQMMYQNSGYQFERRDKKTLILDVADHGTTEPLSKAEEFSVDLFEPLIVDKLSDVYLDSFLTHNSSLCNSIDTMAFSLKINEFNMNSNVASLPKASGQHIFNSIIIPNDHNSINSINSCVIHKGKKLNYVCSINPCKLSKITGKITDLAGNSMGRVLYYVELKLVLAKAVPAGSVFGFNDGVSSSATAGFITAFYMEAGVKQLYFYAQQGTTISDLNTSRNISSSSDIGLGTSETSLVTTGNTFREFDNARFIAEFVIVARD